MNVITKEVASEYFGHDDGVLFWKKSTGPRAIVGKKIQTLSSHGYVTLEFMGKSYKAHQIIFLYITDIFRQKLITLITSEATTELKILGRQAGA